MSLKFRLRGLAETFIETVKCPCCGIVGSDDQSFSTDFTKVTLEGIVVIAQCKNCSEIFVPAERKLGIVNPTELKKAVEKDSYTTGEPIYANAKMVKSSAEMLNAARKDIMM